MSKAKYARSKWMSLIRKGDHEPFIIFLRELGIISRSYSTDFFLESHIMLSRYLMHKHRKDAKIDARSYNRIAPRNIKPTKSR